MYYIRTWLLFTLIYLALTSNLEPLNLLTGGIVGVVVLTLIRPPLESMSPRNYPSSILGAGRYILILIYDLILSGIQIARLVLTPSLPIKPGIINIPSQCQSDLGAALSAHAITLTPGELVVEMDTDRNMYTHVLDATQAPTYVHDAQEMRRELLDQIFP
jgi:multicomponent Na+:H+ antiporter subunit E